MYLMMTQMRWPLGRRGGGGGGEGEASGCISTKVQPLLSLSSFVTLISLVLFCCTNPTTVDCAEATKIVFTKQGPVRGMKIDLSGHRIPSLGKVDAFLGIPYVSAPTGQFRFMPPMSPQPWQTVKDCTEFAPVCPQLLPDLEKGDDRDKLQYMTVGRLNYLKKLFSYLRDQSEDCLYLNIYSPSMSDYERGKAICEIDSIHLKMHYYILIISSSSKQIILPLTTCDILYDIKLYQT